MGRLHVLTMHMKTEGFGCAALIGGRFNHVEPLDRDVVGI